MIIASTINIGIIKENGIQNGLMDVKKYVLLAKKDFI